MSCHSCPPFSGKRFPACFEKYGGFSSAKNPGNVQSLHSLAQNVMPKFYDGVELDYFHRLAPNKFISAAWVLSHVRPSGFRFGGLYTFRVFEDFMVSSITAILIIINLFLYPFVSSIFSLHRQFRVMCIPPHWQQILI